MLYVSYGSNMNLEQMTYRCPNSYVVCNGELCGWKLVFNVHADIVKTNKKNDIVPVVVWNIAEEDWYMLDMYEGYPFYYIKKIVNVILENGKTEKAVVYVMADNRKGIYPPTSNYFNCILKGYKDNGINTDYLYDVLVHSCYNKTKHNQYNPKEVV